MLPEISAGIVSGRVATICCLDSGQPHCFSSFYAFEKDQPALLFKSSPDDPHAPLFENGNPVAGSILPASFTRSGGQEIRFSGTVRPAPDEASDYFHRLFPSSRTIPGRIYSIRLDHVRMAGDGK
ncbi:MAG TPA: hypothetical protein VGD92_00320 [Sphingobacteriaceae bacterium]